MHARRREGRFVSFALRRIERYQQSGIGASAGCRFRPSCSHYAEEALRTRRLPVAVLLIVWRLLRCNPFMHRRVADPVRRTRRWRLRPNTLPTMFSILALSGFIVVVTAGVAEAVGVTGGCQARLNGNDVSLYTSNHALKVKKGGVVQFAGTVPSALIGTPKSQVTSNTHIEVEWITGIGGITSSNHPGSGFLWGGSQAVDNYLKYASGLYHVVGHVDGEPGSWKCDGDAYVWLDDGNPLTKPVGGGAAALTLVGLFGAAYASTAPKPDAGASPESDAPPEGDNNPLTGGKSQAFTMNEGQASDAVISGDRWLATVGCLALIIMAIGGAYVGKGLGAAAMAGGRLGGNREGRLIWSHGHPIVGFFSGLLMGIGITVLLQQFAVWPLTIVTAIVFPVVIAIICSLRAWLGRSYRMVPRTS